MPATPTIHRFFLAPDTPEEKVLPTWAKYAIPLLVFAVFRLLAEHVQELRGVYYGDDAGYVATANYVAQHGRLSLEDNQLYRQFPGLSLLMIPVSWLVHNMTLAGRLVVLSAAVADVCLVQYLFGNFRLTLIFTFFFPWWITETLAIFSESPGVLCFLLAFLALRDLRPWSPGYILCLLASGYSLALRPPSLFLLLPFIAWYGWKHRNGTLLRGALCVAVACVPFLLLLAWCHLTLGQFLPQYKIQHELLLRWMDDPDRQRYYPHTNFAFPTSSLVGGLLDPHEHLGKKAMALLAFLISTAALFALVRRAQTEPDAEQRVLATGFFIALGCYFGFSLCVGGNFGYWGLERYMSQANLILCWALFYRQPVRWPWIVVMAAGFLLYSFFTGPAMHTLGFIK